MRNERGSISLLGLFLTLGFLLFSAVLLDSSSLYLQKRQLVNLSDALALDLADLLQSDSNISAAAPIELELLDATQRPTELVGLLVSGSKVTVSICQQPAALFNFYEVLSTSASKVCARSSATSY